MSIKEFFKQYKKLILYCFILGVVVLAAGGMIWKKWIPENPVLNMQRFVSSDGQISFEYPSEIRLEKKDNRTTFWITRDNIGDIGEVSMYGFDFIENRQGNINELYKENIFFKTNPKTFYGKKDILISGQSAKLYTFCDLDKLGNCADKDRIHEIFIEYNNTIYSFQFGSISTYLQQEVLSSIKFKDGLSDTPKII